MEKHRALPLCRQKNGMTVVGIGGDCSRKNEELTEQLGASRLAIEKLQTSHARAELALESALWGGVSISVSIEDLNVCGVLRVVVERVYEAVRWSVFWRAARRVDEYVGTLSRDRVPELDIYWKRTVVT